MRPTILIALASLLALPAAAERVPQVKTVTLSNGLTILLREDHAVPLVAVELRTRAGSAWDPAGQDGLASLTATLLTHGTATRTEDQVSDDVARLGAALSSYAGTETLRVSGDVPTIETTALSSYLEILADVALRPTFPAANFNKAQTRRLGQLEGLVDARSALADRAFKKATFGTHLYGRSGSGTLKSVTALKRQSVVAYHTANMVPEASAIGMAGDFDTDQTLEALETLFGAKAWPRGQARKDPWKGLKPAPQPTGIRVILVDTGDETLNQAQFRLGIPLTRRYSDEGWHASHILGQVLGGGFTARLNDRLRVKAGLTYGARWRMEDDDVAPGGGYLTTYTSPQDVIKALEMTLEEIARIRTEPVPEKELDGVKQRLIRGFVFRFETAENVLGEHMDLWQERLAIDHLSQLPVRLGAVTAKSLAGVMSDLPDKAYVVAIVGNQLMQPALKTWTQKMGATLEVVGLDWLGVARPTDAK